MCIFFPLLSRCSRKKRSQKYMGERDVPLFRTTAKAMFTPYFAKVRHYFPYSFPFNCKKRLRQGLFEILAKPSYQDDGLALLFLHIVQCPAFLSPDISVSLQSSVCEVLLVLCRWWAAALRPQEPAAGKKRDVSIKHRISIITYNYNS